MTKHQTVKGKAAEATGAPVTGDGSLSRFSADVDAATTPAGEKATSAPAPADKSERLWGGRFAAAPEVAADLQAFGASLPFDQRLWWQDIQGSKAHARMLGKQGIIPAEDAAAIIEGLDGIARDLQTGDHHFYDLADEDIHMNIERELTERIGDAGRRLHTARSRNDQVATDLRLWCREHALLLAQRLLDARYAFIEVARANTDAILPGYTHLQRAQPVLFAHHLLAYERMLKRDYTRMLLASTSAGSISPLGSAALAGTTYPIDRQHVAHELGFGAASINSLDSVSDRDFVLDLIYACTVTMTHLSRLCEELVLWSSGEFGFITLSDTYATGSSIMPQKKNPDYAELVRGKTGRVLGDLVGLFTVLKGLPLAYNKDLQEDKEGVFDAVDTLVGSLQAVTGMIATLTVNREAMRQAAEGGFMAATDLADFLAAKGIPFRDAHEIVGRLVLAAEKDGRTLQQLTLDELCAASPAFDEAARDTLRIESVVARRTSLGGTAPSEVEQRLDDAREALELDVETLAAELEELESILSPAANDFVRQAADAQATHVGALGKHLTTVDALEQETLEHSA